MSVTPYMIKKLGVISIAKFCGILGIIWGLVVGIFMMLGIGGIAAAMGRGALGAGIGIVGLIIMIIVGAIAGFIGGAILAIIYNIVLGAIGGIEMDLEVKA